MEIFTALSALIHRESKDSIPAFMAQSKAKRAGVVEISLGDSQGF